MASAVLGPEGVTRDRSTFDRGRLIREVCQRLPPGADVTANRILALSGELLRDDEVVPVLTDDGPAYTTVDMLASSGTRSTRSRRARPTASESFPASSPIASAELRADQVELVRAIRTARPRQRRAFWWEVAREGPRCVRVVTTSEGPSPRRGRHRDAVPAEAARPPRFESATPGPVAEMSVIWSESAAHLALRDRTEARRSAGRLSDDGVAPDSPRHRHGSREPLVR